MTAFVVDVNVAIVANGGVSQADVACELACVQGLGKAKVGVVVMDDDDHIFSEYRRHLLPRGQAGVGDEFMYWLHQNSYSSSSCERVKITPNNDRVFDEFPSDPDLAEFDEDDRKYVAVALVSKQNPTVLNAVDSDWRDFERALKKNGLTIEQLCSHCLKKK